MTEITRHVVTLEVGGQSLRWWDEITISRSLEQAASVAQVAVVQQRPGQVVVQPQAAAVVRLDGAKILTGYADDVTVDTAPDGSRVQVTARSRTCDLVDCMPAPTSTRRWTAATVGAIVRDLAAPYGVTVTLDALAGDPFPRYRVDDGETCWDAIDRAVRARGLLAVDDASGGLVLTRVSTARHAGTLAEGGNLISFGVAFRGSQRFSTYYVRGQRAGSETVPAALASMVAGVATDAGTPRTRVLVLDGDGLTPAAALDRARWEALTRYGRALEVSCMVPGWVDADGTPWTPGRHVRVRIPSALLDADLVVVDATLSLSAAGGSTSSLVLQPPEAFEAWTEPTPGPRGRRAPKGYQLDAAAVAAAVARAEANR